MFDKPQRIMLPQRGEAGGASLQSYRNLTTNDLGQLLWAAQGVIGADGRRSVPSAGALYPLELYAIVGRVTGLAPGVYRYLTTSDEIIPITRGFQREKLAEAARGQDRIATAAAIVCITAVFDRTTVRYGARGRGYVYMEAGAMLPRTSF